MFDLICSVPIQYVLTDEMHVEGVLTSPKDFN